MPISNKGTSLRVETNINGTIFENEAVRDVYYRRNSQQQTQRAAGTKPMDMKTFGHPTSQEVEEFVMPPEMEKVIADDLTDKGVANNNGWEDITPTKPKRSRKTKQTKQPITDKTND